MPDIFRVDSPLGRAKKAADDGNLPKLNAELPGIAAGANGIKKAADEGSLRDVLDGLDKIGVPVGKIVGDLVVYVGMTQAAIRLINLLLDLTANPFLRSDSKTTTLWMEFNEEEQVVEVDLTASIDKQSEGFVFLDNVERIVSASVTLKTHHQIRLDSVVLRAKFTALGIGQDSLNPSLALNAGDGTGPDQGVISAESNDAFGVTLSKTLRLKRSGTTNFSFNLNPAPGEIAYGLNGGNAAVTLEVAGTAYYQGVKFDINPVTAVDMGLSI